MEEEQHNNQSSDDHSSDDPAGERQLDFYFNYFPPGYRFNPYDEELIVYYLNPKINGQVLPPNRMHEVNIYANHPSVITACYPALDGRWYFFTPREKMYPNGGRPKRSASNGKWKAISRTFDITDKLDGILIGHKRLLDYEEIDDSKEKTLKQKKKSKKTDELTKTIWGMYEYCIHESAEILKLKKKDSSSTRLDYVLCIIYKKENKGKGRKKSKNSALVATDKKEGQLVLNDKPAENAAIVTTLEHPSTSLPIPSAFEVGSTSSSTINLAENVAVATITEHPYTNLPIPSVFEVGSTSSSTINLAENVAVATITEHPYTSLPIPSVFKVGSTSTINLAENVAVATITEHCPCTNSSIPSVFEVGSTSSSSTIKPVEKIDVGTTIEHPCISCSMPSTFEVGSTSNCTIIEYPGHTSMPSTFEVGNTSSDNNNNNATYNFDDIMIDLSWWDGVNLKDILDLQNFENEQF